MRLFFHYDILARDLNQIHLHVDTRPAPQRVHLLLHILILIQIPINSPPHTTTKTIAKYSVLGHRWNQVTP